MKTKLGIIQSPSMTSEGLDGVEMGVSKKNSDRLAFYLRDGIYDDKILAPIREYCMNGIDISIQCGSTEDVIVKIEKIDGAYYWKVRDFGCGLSQNDIETVYGILGETTKEHDMEQAGAFGIGACSGHSYSDTFYVDSYFEGKKKSYAAVLGGNAKGVPIGKIYKINEEDTNETGIEVTLEITNDRYTFIEKTKTLINNFPPDTKIKFIDSDGTVHTPLTPSNSYIKNEYNIHSYGGDIGYYGAVAKIRMGGVIYKSDHPISRNYNFKHNIVVDVPIGHLTIPISRESLEKTANNTKVLKEIDDIILEIYENDEKSLTVPKFGGYISNPKSSRNYEGTWCKYSLSDVFPDTNKLRSIVHHNHKMYDEAIKPNVNGKYIIYTFPEIRTYRSWVKRLEAVLTTDPDYSGYLAVFDTANVMANYSKNTETLDVSDCIFVDVKSLGLPKLVTTPKDKDNSPKEYVVYKHNDKNYYTIEALDEETDSEIYKDADWFKSDKLTRNQFHNRCVAYASSTDDRIGHGQDNNFWTVGAKKMYEGLVEVGFVEVDSQIYKDTISEIFVREAKKRDMDQAQSKVRNVTFKVGVLPQVANAVGKNISKLDRLTKVREMILKEDSPRSRILKQMEDSYSYNTNLTRSDLRMILKMK